MSTSLHNIYYKAQIDLANRQVGENAEHSGGAASYTFAQHMAMAREWCRWNGQKGTEKQALRVMRILTAPNLVRMLGERNVPLPIGCAS